MAPDELRSTALRGLRWTVIARPTTEVILLGSMVVLAHLISPAEFGRYAVAAIVGDLSLIPVAGVGAALIQRPTITRAHIQAGFALGIVTGLALVGLTLAAASFVVTPIFGARTAMLVRLSAPLCMVVAVTTAPSAILQRQLAFRRLSMLDVSSSFVRAVASIAMAVAGLGGVALVLGMLAGGVANSILTWIWAPPPPPRFTKGPTRELWRFGLPASLTAISWIGFRNCDYAIVGARRGALQAGLYYRAYTLGVEYQKKVSLVMTTVGFPMLSRTQSGTEMADLRTQMVRLLTLLLFPLLALLAIIAPVFVPWLFGPAWGPAAVPTQILAAGGAATLVIDSAGAALMAAGRPTAMLFYGCAHFAAYAGAVFLVAPLGLPAVAVAAAVVHAAFLLVAYMLMLRGSLRLALVNLWRDISPAVVSCAVLVSVAYPSSLALSAVHAPALVYLAEVSVAAAVGYFVALRTLFPASLAAMRRFAGHVLPSWPRRRIARRPAPGGAFLRSVSERAGVDLNTADQATGAVLEALAERIARGEVDHLIEHLPAELHVPLKRGRLSARGQGSPIKIDEFVHRVSDRAGVSILTAAVLTRIVFRVLHEVAGERPFRNVIGAGESRPNPPRALVLEDPTKAHAQA